MEDRTLRRCEEILNTISDPTHRRDLWRRNSRKVTVVAVGAQDRFHHCPVVGIGQGEQGPPSGAHPIVRQIEMCSGGLAGHSGQTPGLLVLVIRVNQ